MTETKAIQISKVFGIEDVAAECGYSLKDFEARVEAGDVELVSHASGKVLALGDASCVKVPVKDDKGELRLTQCIFHKREVEQVARQVLKAQLKAEKVDINDLDKGDVARKVKGLVRPLSNLLHARFEQWQEGAKNRAEQRHDGRLSKRAEEQLSNMDLRYFGEGHPYLSMSQLGKYESPAHVPHILGELSQTERENFLNYWGPYWEALQAVLRREMKSGGEKKDGNFDVWNTIRQFEKDWMADHDGKRPFLKVETLCRSFGKGVGRFYLVGRKEAIEHLRTVVIPAQVEGKSKEFFAALRVGPLDRTWIYAWVVRQRDLESGSDQEATPEEIEAFSGGELNFDVMADAFTQLNEQQEAANGGRRRDRRERDRSDRE